MKTKSKDVSKRTQGIILIIVLVVVLGLITLKSASPGVKAKEAKASSTVTLIEQAQQQKLPAWLLFHSKTCESCIEMEKIYQTLEPEFKGKVAFINIDVNDPAEEALLKKYSIEYIPTTYFLDPQGQTIFNFVGVIEEDKMRESLNFLAGGK